MLYKEIYFYSREDSFDLENISDELFDVSFAIHLSISTWNKGVFCIRNSSLT